MRDLILEVAGHPRNSQTMFAFVQKNVDRSSVRLKLLILALVPLVVLMPLLMLIGMSRWTQDYDRLLIANVESDLQIAEQYLQRIVDGTGTSVESLAASAQFRDNAQNGSLGPYLEQTRTELGLDFLQIIEREELDESTRRWPVVKSALAGKARTEIDLFSASDLLMIDTRLAQQAEIPLIPTEAAVPTERAVETRGMVIHTAAPVTLGDKQAVLVGGVLLNRNLDFIDTINTLVYQSEQTAETRQGTATLFLEDVRVSTNVRLFENVRALGTRVSAQVRHQVLDQGKTWLDRAFVVNDWYISGYLPIVDSFDNRIGMLYVGFLEQPFQQIKRTAVLTMILVFLAVLIVSIPFFLRLAGGVFSPLERITNTMRKVEAGDLSARTVLRQTSGEIAQVSEHLNNLLDQIQERDKSLRDWADDLNNRVEQRTAELREANSKLEKTFKQLMMSEKLASIGEITAGVAHEINNPVAVIQGNVDLLRMTLGDTAQGVKTELDLIDQQIMRIGAIVGKLLQFARPAEYGKFEENVDVTAVTYDCLGLVNHVYASTDIDLQLDLNDVPFVNINTSELQQVIINLIVNAVQAIGKRGTLHLRTYAPIDHDTYGVVIEFHDTGAGIDPKDISSIFDPFFSTKKGTGTGLGLSISQNIIQNAGGIITAENAPSGGAVFKIWLPTQRTVIETET